VAVVLEVRRVCPEIAALARPPPVPVMQVAMQSYSSTGMAIGTHAHNADVE